MSPAITDTHPNNGGAQKHRACDECRSRKLACSKEPAGCSRCMREGLTCHYSPQKQMGRPRKRPRPDTQEENDGEPFVVEALFEDVAMVDGTGPGLDFLNGLSGQSLDIPEEWDPVTMHVPDMAESRKAPSPAPEATLGPWDQFGYAANRYGSTLSFDAVPAHADSLSNGNNIDPALHQSSDTLEKVPSLSPNSSSTSESGGSQGQNTSKTSCACVASLYLALESLKSMPSEIGQAMCTARLATKTAYKVVTCPNCAWPVDGKELLAPEHLSFEQQMQRFQTLMMLGALLPSIAKTYEDILKKIDHEACLAHREQRTLRFDLNEYGGSWGGNCNNSCHTSSSSLYGQALDPSVWRTAIRALLRVDVYGITDVRSEPSDSRHEANPHLGLKSIVDLMEKRSHQRHSHRDVMISSGAWAEPESCAFKFWNASKGEKPTCMQVITIAKNAIDNLVIA